jgi:hypothetical protein
MKICGNETAIEEKSSIVGKAGMVRVSGCLHNWALNFTLPKLTNFEVEQDGRKS